MIKSIQDRCILNNQVEMPWLGYGVFQMKVGAETEESVSTALETGYRSIDTAAIYKNETEVGNAIASSGIPRREIFVTTKVWNSDHGYETTLKAFEISRKKLKLDYIDLYLIHWPGSAPLEESFSALNQLQREGKILHIGVSNFGLDLLTKAVALSETPLATNQVPYSVSDRSYVRNGVLDYSITARCAPTRRCRARWCSSSRMPPPGR